MTEHRVDYERTLYPFLYDSPDSDVERLKAAALDEVKRSTLQKCRDVVSLRQRLFEEHADRLVECAVAMARAFERGKKLLAFGNGGSATDAQDAAADCLAPPFPHWRALPALSLTNDVAVVTAVGNDVGFDNVFSRQIIAFGERGDIALGISTSGSSHNVLAALAEARRRGLVTVAFSGFDGGAMEPSETIDFCFTARLEYIPRIQEGHATLWHTLLELIHEVLGGRGADDAASSRA